MISTLAFSISSPFIDAGMSSQVVKLRGLGRLRGVIERNIDGGNYLAFKGVPYAKPPVGNLRFSDPIPPEPWIGIRDAAKYGSPSGQYDIVQKKLCGSDDCLYLNVYVPSSEGKTTLVENLIRFSGHSPSYGQTIWAESAQIIGGIWSESDQNLGTHDLPVMVWLHGGVFAYGSGDNSIHGPDYLLKKDVIVVTINYRLGVFGFLNLEHQVAPGNQGLKDQVLALKWIQEHVEAFGGDKNNVTLFGESAGAACVHFLSLSPLAQGLFHKAIAQSGTGFCPWASVLQSPKSNAIRLLEYLGKPYLGEQETVDFLRTVECAKLVEAQTKIQTYQERAQVVWLFGPGVDDTANVPFLPNFVSSIENGSVKVPLLLGYNNGEGITFSKVFNKARCEAINANFDYILHPQVLAAIKRDKKLTSADVKRAYFGDEPLHPEKSIKKFIELYGDMHTFIGVNELAKKQASKSEGPTYLYRFSFDNGTSHMKMLMNMTHIPGACHADELTYLFYPHGLSALGYEPPEAGSRERILIERMTQMWTDFAKTGNPIPAESEFVKTTWKPIRKANELHYLEINDELSPASNPDAARLLVWNKLPNKL